MLSVITFRQCRLIPLIDMDVIFALAYQEGVSPVKVSLRNHVPAAGTEEADQILGIDASIRRRHGSDVLSDGK